MAAAANAGRKAAPRMLRIVSGNVGADGMPRDSGGRPIEPGVSFDRKPPTKPEGLSEDAEWLWDQVVDQMTTVGLLKPLDGAGLEVACETFARWRDAVRARQWKGMLSTNSQGLVTAPWVGIEERASREFRAWCAEFGITPAAERHLRAESGGTSDDGPF